MNSPIQNKYPPDFQKRTPNKKHMHKDIEIFGNLFYNYINMFDEGDTKNV